ncbi:MAG TPA: acyl carrier protein [Solirubrobacteraceae bacterium]|nr:acyl carrier protein [Solirubrobacteraceae bacterium]
MIQLGPSDVRGFIVEELKEQIELAELSPDALVDTLDLHASGIIDSLGLLELIAAVEDRFALEIDFEDLDADDLTVLGPLCRFVAEQAAPAQA